MYVESRPKESGFSFMEIFPDDVFPMDSEQDKIKSKDAVADHLLLSKQDNG